ncbi:hypothetical protein C5167_023734 [Papaver somniferum]|uniref:Uncharacterized protein n=1 Tax=Papaver somniferum TaxID=3469 RepID=A0A4Y7JQB9_PAPSO|nr:hypothetical protein C5167_023734 [Papaver somniferum]
MYFVFEYMLTSIRRCASSTISSWGDKEEETNFSVESGVLALVSLQTEIPGRDISCNYDYWMCESSSGKNLKNCCCHINKVLDEK